MGLNSTGSSGYFYSKQNSLSWTPGKVIRPKSPYLATGRTKAIFVRFHPMPAELADLNETSNQY